VTSQLVALNIDANEPRRLAEFWAVALRWQVGDDGVTAVPTDGTRLELSFAEVPEPKVGKNRIHLDLTSSSLEDQEATVGQLLALGAHLIDVGQAPEDEHVVLADPEGNELCVIEPGNRFLATCGRLGSITCDGSPTAGYFWRDVLRWPLVWDQDDETAVRAPDLTGPYLTWGPPVPAKTANNRLHLDIAPIDGVDQQAEVERLRGLGATVVDIGQGDDGIVMADPEGSASKKASELGAVVLADPDGTVFRVLPPRADSRI